MKEVKYFAPKDLEEAVKLLAEYSDKATILAGGTDLMPRINYYELKPEVIIYLGGLNSTDPVERDGGVVINAMTTTAKLTRSELINRKAGALAEAARLTGCNETRNTGTIGGNLGNASPAADLATPLLAMDAELLLKSAGGERVVAVNDFFLGPGQTVCKPDELIAEVRLPGSAGRTVFLKLGRRKAMTLSVVNVAVRLDMSGQTCNQARIALGSMAPRPMRCLKAEGMLEGKGLDQDLIKKCAAQAVDETSPIDDQRATAWYRKKAGVAITARALTQAAGIAG
jgi:carbon-monoxide dehydrogenase medium subunit